MKKIDSYVANQNDGILLNANENYQNLSFPIRQKIAEAILNCDFNRYPDDHNTIVAKSYAEYINMDEDQILVGNGSDEVLGLLIGLKMGKNKKLYTFSLDFSMYDYYATMYDGEVIKYEYPIEKQFNVEEFIDQGKKEKVDMILFSNPNNPTGRAIAQEDIIKIVKAFSDIYVVIDEAYADFDESTMLPYVNEYNNLFVTRTMSKAFTSAALRCGFLVGNKKEMENIMPYKVPYNVNTLTQLSASIVLKYSDEIKQNIDEIKKERDSLFEKFIQLNRKDIILYPSKTNYLYGKTSRKEALMKAFDEKQIVIRNYKDDSFRITIGSKEQNEIVFDVLRTF